MPFSATTASLLPLLLASLTLVSGAPSTLHARASYDSSHKAGLSWTDTSVDVSQFTSKASWYYNWGPSPAYPESAMNGLEYVPMFWGNKTIPDFGGVAPLVTAGTVKNVLGMNEPETPGQSQLSPAEAAELWTTYMQPLKTNTPAVRLGSPAMTNTQTAIQWMQQFQGNCTSCTIDFMVLHYYYINSTDMIGFLTDFNNAFQKPIWVTEWACENFADSGDQCTAAQISDYMNVTESFMDSTSWVERYAWFGAFRTMPSGLNPALALFDSSGKINTLGQQYIGAAGSSPSGSGGGGNGGGVGIGAASSRYDSGSLRAWSMVVSIGLMVLGVGLL